MKQKQNQSGRSMIEMLGVLAIIAVLSVGGIAGYSKAMIKFKANKTVEQVTHIVTGFMTAFANQKDYEALCSDEWENLEPLKDLGIITNSEIIEETNLINPFKGELFVCAPSFNNVLEIGVWDLPREACLLLATNDWGNSLFGIEVCKNGNLGWDFPLSWLNAPGVTNAPETAVKDGHILSIRNFPRKEDGLVVSIPLSPDIAAKGCTCKEDTCGVILYFNRS